MISEPAKTEIEPIKIVFVNIAGHQVPSIVDKDQLLKVHAKVDLDDDDFHSCSYGGGKQYIKGNYLFSHAREKTDEYDKRKERSYFYNYCRPVVDSYLFFLFKTNPERCGAAATLPDIINFLVDPTKGVEDLDGVMREHAFRVLLYGRAWLQMDRPTSAPGSQLDERVRENLPYLFHVDTKDILDWATGSEGRLEWIKIRERSNAKRDFSYASETVDSVKIWYPTFWVQYDLEGKLVGRAEHSLGCVPFIGTFLNDELKSFISDISIINRALYNWCSLLDEILYKQTFSQLAMPGDTKQSLSEKRIGIAAAFTFDPKATHAPRYIAPDADQARVIQEQVGAAIAEIYRHANLEWQDSQRSGNKSGSAKMFDFQNTNKILSGLAFKLEATEKVIFLMYNSLRGNTKRDIPESRYPRDFSVASLENEITNIFFSLSRSISSTLNKLLKKRLVSLLCPRITTEDKKKIEDEIDQTDETLAASSDSQGVSQRFKQMVDSAMASNVTGMGAINIQRAVK